MFSALQLNAGNIARFAGSAGGFATRTGTLTPGNVAILTATGIMDGGLTPVTSIPANNAWANPLSIAGAPIAVAVLNMTNGTPGAPTYTGTDADSGIHFPASNQVAVACGGSTIVLFRAPTGAFSLQLSAGSTPTVAAVGTNGQLQLTGSGTGSVTLMNGGTSGTGIAQLILLSARIGSGTVVNYPEVRGSATTAPVQYSADGTDTDVGIALTPKGAGLVAFNNAASFSANAAIGTAVTGVGPTGSHTTVQEWLTISNQSGVTRYIPCF